MRAHRPADLAGTLTFLDAFARVHFAAEERLMAGRGYPGLEAHQGEHREFSRRLAELRARFARGGQHLSLTVELSTWLSDWLRGHIREQDGALGRFLRGEPGAA